MTRLRFLGAAGTVTGSRYLLQDAGRPLLVDCGLFQGLKQLRLRNRARWPVHPAEIEHIVLTHAHLDHSGYIPALVRDGFRGRVFATPATCDLCRILLPDSGHLQEEEAARANRYGYSKHRPALPLYTRADADRALERLEPVPFGHDARAGSWRFRFHRAGHIPGAATVTLQDGPRTLVFSGDLGRPEDPLLRAPEPITAADYVVVESTYGDRSHPPDDPADVLAAIVAPTLQRGGVVIVPAFAVGRAQIILYYLHGLRRSGRIPDVPIFLDSPMAEQATSLLLRHASEHRLPPAEYAEVCAGGIMTSSADESKAIDRRSGPMIIISASGMATGGRVLFHLARFAGDPRNTILLAGFQAAGTRGEALKRGVRELRIHGAMIPVRAEVAAIDALSAHADAGEIIDWLQHFERPPATTFITHGEPIAADALRFRIEQQLGWHAAVPEHDETVTLG